MSCFLSSPVHLRFAARFNNSPYQPTVGAAAAAAAVNMISPSYQVSQNVFALLVSEDTVNLRCARAVFLFACM